jgi:tetratricopeptide (TPR) repeat protein
MRPNGKIFAILIAIGFCFPLFVDGLSWGTSLDTTYPGSEMSEPEELTGTDLGQMDPTTANLNLAEARLKQGLWREAVQYAQLVISRDKKNSKAQGILGTIYALGGQKKLAESQLTFLKETGENSFYGELIEAILEAQEKKFKEAEKHLGSALQKEPDHPVALYYSGSLSLAQNDLEKAEKAFKTVIASSPNFPPALAELGQVYWREKKTQDAISYYQKAIKNDPENLLYRKQLIEIYKFTGQKEEVSNALIEFAYYTPGVKELYLDRGLELLLTGSYQEAIQLADKLLGIYKRFPGGYYIKAVAEINLGQEENASDNIDSFLRMGFGIPRTHHEAGMCYLALGEIDKADAQFKRVISLDPESGKSFIPMTIIEQMRGNYDRALQGLRLTLSQGEPPPLVHFLMANIFMAKGDKDHYQEEMAIGREMVPGMKPESKTFFPAGKEMEKFAEDRNLMAIFFLNGWYDKAVHRSDAILKMNKNDLFAWWYKGLSKMAQKENHEAIRSFKQAIFVEPNLLSGYMSLGQIYLRINDYQEALKAFGKAIEIDPSNGPAYLALGDAYLQIEKKEKAIQSYREAIKLTPRSPDGYERLAFVLSERPKESEEALKFATKAVELAPKDPLSLDALGWVYIQRGDVKKGIEKLEEASRLSSRDPVILYHLGVGYYKDGNAVEAKTVLEAALGISKDFRGADQATEILKKIE